MIDLTADIDTEKAKRNLEGLRQSAKRVVSGMINDFELLDSAVIRFNKTLGSVGGGLHIPGLSAKIKQAQNEFNKLDGVIMTPKMTESASKEVNALIASLEHLDKVLMDLPDRAGGFDTIASSMRSLVAQADIFITKIAQIQQSAVPIPNKTQTQHTPTASSTQSSAPMIEAASYRELLNELKAVSGTKLQLIGQIEALKLKNKEYKVTVDAVNKSESDGMRISQERASQRRNAALAIEQNKVLIQSLQRELREQIKVEQAVETSINDMTASLKRMQTVYSQLDAEQRQSSFGQNLYKNIEELEQRINGVGSAMQSQTQKVGYYASGFNGLSFQIQQVARELPSLAYGPQTFFAAISNNLPMLTDEISRARTQYNELLKSGQKATPVWKQILSSLVSWQTLIVAGVTVLTLYGKEIVNWTASLFKGRKEIDSAKIALEQFHAAMTKGAVAAQDEITKLDLLYRAATDAAKPYEERKKAVERLQEIYPAYFGNMDSEMIMTGRLKGKYDELKASIIEVAQARASASQITELQGQKITIEQISGYQQLLGIRKQYDALLTRGRLKGQTDEEFTGILQSYIEAMNDAQKAAEKALEKTNKDLYEKIKESGVKYYTEYVDLIDEQSKKLASTAEKQFTSTTPGEANKDAEKAMQAAEKDAEKAKQLRKKLNSQLEELTLNAQEASIQAEIDLMADGTTKKLAQIDLDYQKRQRAIRKGVSELQKLWLEEYKYRNAQDKDSDQYKARQQMETQFKGNVDHLARPLIDAAELVKKGWEDAGEGIATVFSSQYGILDAKGKETEILVTPILPNGDILSPQELEDYIFNQLEGAQDILKADTKGIVIATNVSTDGSAGEKYHQLQGEYYADAIEFAESLRIRTQALNDANEAIRQSERHEALAGKPAKIDLWKDFEEDQKAWNEYYEKYGTFRERLQATKDKYDRKLAEAQNEGERTSIQAEYDAALAQFEVESSSWTKELINKTIGELENIQTQLEKELEAAKRTFNAFESSSDPEAQQWAARINTLESKLKLLAPQINKAKKAASDSDWAKGALALNAIADGAREALNGIRDLDEGLADALESIVNIASSAGSFADSIKGIKAGDLSFGSITGAITSGISFISSIVGLFKGGETSMERNIRLAKEFNEELRVMNEQAKINSDAFSSIFGDNAWGNYVNNINVLNEAASKYGDTLERVKKRGKEVVVDFGEYGGRANLQKVDKTWESATESVANMLVQTRHSTWFRSAKYKSLKDLLPELFEGDEINMENLKKFVDSNNDTFKHLGKENQDYLKGLVANWDTYQQAVEAVNDYLTEILGDLGNSLTDALVDSFESGTDAAEAFGEAVGDMLKNMAKQVLYNATLAPLINEAQAQLEEINKDTSLSNEDRFNAYTKVIGDLMDEVLAQQESGQDLWDRLRKMAEEKGIDWGGETASGQTATSRGFQAMSQDTGDELNGRFTDMQGKMNILVSGMDMLRSINMDTRNTSIDIRDIMIQLNGNVADIRTFTRVLPEMSSTLTSMNKKLDNL